MTTLEASSRSELEALAERARSGIHSFETFGRAIVVAAISAAAQQAKHPAADPPPPVFLEFEARRVGADKWQICRLGKRGPDDCVTVHFEPDNQHVPDPNGQPSALP